MSIAKAWHSIFHHTRKNNKIWYYICGFAKLYTPSLLLKLQMKSIMRYYKQLSEKELHEVLARVNHYMKFNGPCPLPDDCMEVDEFTWKHHITYRRIESNSTYFFDIKEWLRFLPKKLKWAYNPGDINYIFPSPQITKSRPITEDDANRNNIIMNLDKVRHFTFVKDPISWEDKKPVVIFRGDCYGKPHRTRFVELWGDDKDCDLKATDHKSGLAEHQVAKRPMSLYDHLKYRYIMALEGNDVASNLKWVMSSNSVAVMPQPKFETWYMEAKLIPGYHYVEIADDYHDLKEKIQYYEEHPDEAKAIVAHAHEWVAQFQDSKREALISLMVLDKYFHLTGQTDLKWYPS